MAFPLTRYLTFASLSQIPSAFLNAVQDAIIGITIGTQTVRGVVLDGVGGNSSTTPVFPAKGTSTPTPTTVKGTLYRELVPFAVGLVISPTTLTWGVNVSSITHTGTGAYEINFTNSAVASQHITMVTPLGNDVFLFGQSTVNTGKVILTFKNAAGTSVDANFYFLTFSS